MEFEAGRDVLDAELSAGTADVWDWIGLHSFFFIRTKFIRTSSLRFHTILRTF